MTISVLHVLHTFPQDSHGGIETYVERLAVAQRAAGLSVTVLAGRDGPTERGADAPVVTETESAGVLVWRLRPWPFDLDRADVNPDVEAVFPGLLARRRIDLVHVHPWPFRQHRTDSPRVRWARRPFALPIPPPRSGEANKIRLLSHRAYGFHSALPLIATIFLCCGGITLPDLQLA